MDNFAQLYELGDSSSAPSYHTLLNNNGNVLDFFANNGREGTSKTLFSFMEGDAFWSEEPGICSFQNQNKVLDPFLCIDEPFFEDKKDLKNETINPNLQVPDFYENQDEILVRRESTTETENIETEKTEVLKTVPKKDEITRLKLGIKCNSCEAILGNRRNFISHYKKCCDKVTEFTCSICDKCFKNYLSFRSHWYRHNPHKYKCSYCDKVFNIRTKLVSHEIAMHSDFRPYVCKICDKGYASRSSLSCHEKTHDQQLSSHTCHICKKVLLSNQSFSRHVKLHEIGRCFMCEVCGDRFSYKSHLLDHLSNVHAENRPFNCEKCGKKFAEITHLKRHLKLHAEERPFKCEDCFKTFKTKNCLTYHCRWHKEIKPFICSFCNKGFVRMSKLKEHFNTHTGDRPFICKFCDRSFTNNSNLIKHTRRIHKKKEINENIPIPTLPSNMISDISSPEPMPILCIDQDFSFIDSFPAEFL